MAGYQISTDEALSGAVANAGDAASEAGFVLNGIHGAYDSADNLQNVTGYTRDAAYKQLDAIRMTIEDDVKAIPGDPSTELDPLWWDPLRRDLLMGFQTIRQVREKANETVSLSDYLAGIASKAPGKVADAVAPITKPIFDNALLALVVVGVLLFLLLNTGAAAALVKVVV
jgi:hypothetical protein